MTHSHSSNLHTTVINGRFRARSRHSGVDRYAQELVDALDLEVVEPGTAFRGRLLANVWEQVILPVRARGRLVMSPCNSGPIAYRNQIVILHDIAPIVGPQWFSWRYRAKFRILTTLLFKRVRTVATVSASSADDIRVFIGRNDEIPIIPNTPRPPVASSTLSSSTPPPHTERFFLVVGNLDPRKNLTTVIAAWERLAPNLPDWSLVVVGAANPSIFGKPDDGASLRASWLGYVGDGDLGWLYQHCSALVAASFYEGCGRPIIEAESSGAAVIASDIPAHREVASQRTHFFDPHDTEALTTAMLAVVHSDAPLHRTAVAQNATESDTAIRISAEAAVSLTLSR